MQYLGKFGGATTLAIIFSSNMAAADLSANDVWSDWRNYMQSLGYEMSGTETMSGNTLTVDGMVVQTILPEGEGLISITMDPLTFVENGDGTVAIGLPRSMPIQMNITPKTGESLQASIGYTQNGATMVVSGDPAEMTYNFTAVDIALALEELIVDGNEIPRSDVAVGVNFSSLVGSTRMTTGTVRGYAQQSSIDGMSYDVSFVDPENGGRAKFRGTLDELTFGGAGDIPMLPTTTDVNEMLNAGFRFDGAFQYQGGNTEFEMQSPGGALAGSSSSASGKASVAMDPAGLAYDVSQSDVSLNLRVPNFPLPITMDMAESLFKLAIPIMKSDEAQDFRFAFTMGDFVISDALWGLFDPAGKLPRDPATLTLDLSGKAKMLVDVLDPEAAGKMEAAGESPGQLQALTLNALELTAAGASLKGDGDFVFDNTDTLTFNGMPKPTGAIDLNLIGGNGLLDKLVELGLLPEDQAMGARMMMGLFAVPGDTPDTLNSKIEINDQGHVLANGQRIQ